MAKTQIAPKRRRKQRKQENNTESESSSTDPEYMQRSTKETKAGKSGIVMSKIRGV